MRRVTNQAGIDLIKRFEGFSPMRYICPAGYPTIGYGHMIVEGEHFDQPMSEQQAEELLERDIQRYEVAVQRMVKVLISDNEFAALVSFAYNLGSGRLKASTLLRLLNRGQEEAAAEEFAKWRMGGGRILPGLEARRAAEKRLFLSGLASRQRDALPWL